MSTPWERRRNNQAPADPRFPYQGPLAAGQVANTNAQTGRTVVQTQGDQIDNRVKTQTAVPVVRKANAEAAEAEARARAAAQEQGGKRQQWDEFGNIINSLTEQYDRNFKGAGGSSGRGRFAEYMPSSVFGKTTNSANDTFDSTAMRAGPFLKTILFPGSKDTDAAAEYKQKVMPFIPQSGDSDEKIADKIKQLRRIYEGQAKAAGIAPRTNAGAPRKAAPVIDFNKWGN